MRTTNHEPRTTNQLLFLVGYRGTGKTSVAQLLARRLGWDWVDADSYLEAKHGCTIREIFAAEGEAGFRDKESACLEELCGRQRHVIATGGGVVLRATNQERLCVAGRVVWLTADAATLWQRIEQDTATRERRPNLSMGGLTEVEQLLSVRQPLYRAVASLEVSTVGRSPEEVAEHILTQVCLS